MPRAFIWLAAALLLQPLCLRAADKPDMTKQKTWGEKEKDAFYEWLKEQEGRAPSTAGEKRQVKTRTMTIEQMQQIPGNLKNSYLSMRFALYDMANLQINYTPQQPEISDVEGIVGEIVDDPTGLEETEDSTLTGELDADLIGLEIQYGRPIKTWFRQLYTLGYYRGSVDWGVAEHLEADYNLFRTGYHLELALVPLGLDQTRNIVLRGGIDLLYGRKGELDPVVEDDLEAQSRRTMEERMLDQVTGLQAGISWSVGYERQLGENFWRLYGMVDGFRAAHLPRDDNREDYSTLGLAVGITKVF